MIDPLTYLWLLLKASLFSTGGMGNLPSIHDDFTTRGWASDQQFAESLAVGQVSPGPSGLWVISFGFLTYGYVGALLALVAITIPPLLVLVIDRLHRRVGDHPAMQGFVRGLSLAVVGISAVIFAGLVANDQFDIRTALIMVASFALGTTRRVPVVVLLLLAGLAGVLIY